MKLAIVLDTEGAEGLVYELAAAQTIGPDEPALELGAFVGTFPVPGAMLAAMMGIPTDPHAGAIPAVSRPTSGTPYV